MSNLSGFHYTESAESRIVALTAPVYAGRWKIGGPYGLGVSQTRKPRWLTRVMCRWLLEWEWVDEERQPLPKFHEAMDALMQEVQDER